MRVSIRPLKIADARTSYKWRNDPYIWEYTDKKPDRFITEEIEIEWLKQVLEENDSYRFAIMVDDRYVGNIQITNIVEGEYGEYHIFIGEKKFWGKGIASLATIQILKFAKEELKLKFLYLYVNPKNIPAIHVYEKCGFKKVSKKLRMEIALY